MNWAQEGLWGLFAAGFVSATVFPASSELLFLGYLSQFPHHAWAAFSFVSLGNILGGLSSVFIGRRFPNKYTPPPNIQSFLTRYGALSLFFSWLPIVGDVLCLTAGWLRLSVVPVVCWLSIGKCVRYGGLMLLFYNAPT